MFLADQKITLEQSLLAIIADNTNYLLWAQSKDAEKGQNRPESLYVLLTEGPKEKEYKTFNTLEEFEQAKARILGGG